jgi:hypothetical protein
MPDTDIVRFGESIEGLAVDGYSRNPLINRGLVKYQGRKCYRFCASFNIKSKIVKQITNVMIIDGLITKIEANSICELNNELICDKAIIHSLDNRYSSSLVSNLTATHGSNSWHFSRQTAVKIEISHQELINSISNRELRELSNIE